MNGKAGTHTIEHAEAIGSGAKITNTADMKHSMLIII